MNRTEMRQCIRNMGVGRAYRHATIDDLNACIEPPIHAPPQQEIIRQKVQIYARRNWEVLKEVLDCNGDCASKENNCPDAQSSICYHANVALIEN